MERALELNPGHAQTLEQVENLKRLLSGESPQVTINSPEVTIESSEVTTESTSPVTDPDSSEEISPDEEAMS